MNCKQGDLAIGVRVSAAANDWVIGRIVLCEQLRIVRGFSGWMIEGQIVSPDSHNFDYAWVADHCLRPLRDQPGDDETLEWSGLPINIGVAA